MAKNVTNAQVADAIRLLGINLPPDLDLTGAQNNEWVRKLVNVIQPMLPPGQYAQDIFNKGKEAARKIADIPADASTRDRLAGTLSALGVGGHELNQILVKAQDFGHTAGRAYNDQDYSDAVSAVLGNDNPLVQRTFQTMQLPPPRSVGTQPFGSAADQAQPAPPPAPPPPLPPGSGVKMGTNVSRATPGVAAPDTTPKPAPAPTPGPAKPPPPDLTNTAEGGATVKALPKNATDAQVEQYLKENYGSDTWVLAVPEIRKIVFDSLKNPSGVTQGIITSAIQATPWWQQNGKNVADFLQGQATNARGLNDKILEKQRQLDQKAAALGITLAPERNLAIATDWEKWQWGDTAVNAALSGEFHYNNNQGTQFTDQLKTDAKNYLVPIGDETIQQWGQKIIANPNEKLNWTEFLKNQAISAFPQFASRLQGNETMAQIAAPYAGYASTLLEMDPKDVDFTQSKWLAALDQVDDKGNHNSMSYADWQRKLKDDPTYRFDYTEQAKQSATGMATSLLKTFGAIA